MKFNKKFLGIFLGLSVVFSSSVLVSARDIVQVSENEGVETITKKQNINNIEEKSEDEKLFLEKLKGFLKELKTNPKESVYKDVIDFRIKESEKKLKKAGKKEAKFLKEEINRLKKLKKKEKLSDLDKGNIKMNLESSIEMAKSNLNDVKKYIEAKSEGIKESSEKPEQNKNYMVGFLYENAGMEKTKDRN